MKLFKGILIITLALSVTIGGAGLRQIICKCFDCDKVMALSEQVSSCCCEDAVSCHMDEINDDSKNCCDESSKEAPCTPEVKKISFDWDSRHIDSQSFTQITCLPVTIQTDLFLLQPVIGNSLFFADYSGPPLFSPKEYLSFIQVFLI